MSEFTVEDLKLLIKALFKNKLLICLVTVAGTCLGMIYTANLSNDTMYNATASVCVTYSVYQDPIPNNNVMTNYSGVVISNRVCEAASALLAEKGLDYSAQRIQKMIKVVTANNSYVMEINAQSPYGELAILVVNATAEAFVTQVSNLSGNNSIQVLDLANTANIISHGRTNQIRILSFALSFLIVCGCICLNELLSGKIRSIPQCFEDEDEILGIIPYIE